MMNLWKGSKMKGFPRSGSSIQAFPLLVAQGLFDDPMQNSGALWSIQ